MYSLRDADVVIALGTRLSPFGTLPQYGEDYYPTKAKVIQVYQENTAVILNEYNLILSLVQSLSIYLMRTLHFYVIDWIGGGSH